MIVGIQNSLSLKWLPITVFIINNLGVISYFHPTSCVQIVFFRHYFVGRKNGQETQTCENFRASFKAADDPSLWARVNQQPTMWDVYR
jgi:hypothetical protein